MSPIVPDPALVPPEVLHALRTLRAAGKQGFLAGGAVRDALRVARWNAGLDRPRSPIAQAWTQSPGAPQDFDIATDALPDEVMRLFPKVIPTGVQHGTVTVLLGEHKLELTTFRGEGPYLDGRRPSSVTFLGDIVGDLARRDFTVNAIAWDPLTAGEAGLRDPFDGVGDLSRRVLRAVGNPEHRFSEDGLRPLRAVRFATTLRLALDPATRRAITATLDTFSKVAAERVHDELVKLLVRGAPPSRGLRLLVRTGLLARIAPELVESVAFPQNRWHQWDVWRHTLRVVDAAAAETRDLIVLLSALLHDVAKPRTAQPKPESPSENSFHQHEHVGATLTSEILTRLRFSKREVERVTLHVREHNWHYLPEWTDATCRRVIARLGPEELGTQWSLRRADLRGRGRAVEEGLANQAALESRFARVLKDSSALRVTDLAIGGRELMQDLGLRPGPAVGQLLKRLLEAVLDDPSLNTPASLIRLASEAASRPSTDNSQP
ncbi:MAG: HD domain-containing protein [Deltaproteobacteria bacterium]|nr:HD domain-containing protein [Deltaproteobacteria bacterium]